MVQLAEKQPLSPANVLSLLASATCGPLGLSTIDSCLPSALVLERVASDVRIEDRSARITGSLPQSGRRTTFQVLPPVSHRSFNEYARSCNIVTFHWLQKPNFAPGSSYKTTASRSRHNGTD
jgi:hypothetical protein